MIFRSPRPRPAVDGPRRRRAHLSATASAISPRRTVAPLVREMDEHAKIPRSLDRPALRPRRHGHRECLSDTAAAGGRFFHSVLAVEELSRVDPSVGVLVDVQNTLVINALAALGQRRHQAALPAAARRRHGRRLRAVGSRLGQRRVRADDAGARGRRRLRAHRAQALDHERQRGRPLHRLRDRQPGGRLPRHHGVPRRARLRRVHASARRKTSSASAPAARAS